MVCIETLRGNGRKGALSTAAKENGHYSTAHRRLLRLTQKKKLISKFKKSRASSMFLGSRKGAHEMLSSKHLLICY